MRLSHLLLALLALCTLLARADIIEEDDDPVDPYRTPAIIGVTFTIATIGAALAIFAVLYCKPENNVEPGTPEEKSLLIQ